MAFCDLKPVRVYDDASGCTYIFGDVFTVYTFGNENPVIFSWDMAKSVVITRSSISLSIGGSAFKLLRKNFPVNEDYFRAVAIVECMQGRYDFHYIHEKRMFPLKCEYTETAPGKDAYFGEGEIDEADAAATFIALMNFKLMRVIWLIAVLMMLISFGALHLMFGINHENLLYFIPISAATGGIITLLLYMASHAVARSRFRSLADCDPATKETISFVVSQIGFAACESCTYDGHDLVPWNKVDYFMESDKMFIFFRDNTPVVFIPKKAFDKKHLGGIENIISLKLEQR